MKTVKKQIEEIMDIPFNGHPSRESEDRIKKLERIVLKLAQQVDNIHYNSHG